ncbi:SDR family NAD(P)-dependent oxidoreductase [Cryobacterium sp. N21]|uniref:SDR family NAD(P)-dependent oxidoreductase n=1 Tax=Cryobacterium sp. N21 TaxID=2048289 RepID=UPI001124D277|nr:SDR family oxidoreductase [Cryobacterium sp. N21]
MIRTAPASPSMVLESACMLDLTSAFITTKHVLPHMLALGGGAIVNIGSIGSMRYLGYNYPIYSSTRGGLVQFTVNVALEYASRGYPANCIAPGLIETPMMYEQIVGNYDSVEDILAQRNALSPTGSMDDSFDIANTTVSLASDEARYVNGIYLPTDGGLTAAVAQ